VWWSHGVNVEAVLAVQLKAGHLGHDTDTLRPITSVNEVTLQRRLVDQWSCDE
jgi:hypothetical protein